MRLIDAGAIIKRAEESFRNAGLHGEDYRKFKKWLRTTPTIDAVDVVRCKDCKHHEKFCFDDSKLLCWVHDIDIVVSPTDYCSFAERREESEVK